MPDNPFFYQLKFKNQLKGQQLLPQVQPELTAALPIEGEQIVYGGTESSGLVAGEVLQEEFKPKTEDEEVEEIKQETKKRYYETPKFKMWVKYMSDQKNKETYMHQTNSALKAYNLDPETDYNTAAVIGSKNLKKVKNIASIHYQKHGITYGKILDLIWNKAVTSNDTKLLQWVADISGATLPRELPTNAPNWQQNIQNNFGGDLDNYDDAQLDRAIETTRGQITPTQTPNGKAPADETKSPQILKPTQQTTGGIG